MRRGVAFLYKPHAFKIFAAGRQAGKQAGGAHIVALPPGHAGMWPHRLQVQWRWASCAPFIQGTIRSWPKEGSNPYWQALFFANHR